MSHAFFVTAMKACFDPSEKLRYSEFCAITAYRFGKDEVDNTDPDINLLLKEFDSHIHTKVQPVF